MPHHVPFWRRVLVATDPGRLRLVNALSVAAAVLLSALIAWLLVTFAHGDHALLAMGAFLALQMGMVVKDPIPRHRIITTALLALPIVASLCLATALSRWHLLEIVIFISLGGLAIWLRRFGPRASAVGTMAFFAYFFALFLRPSFDQLPEFILTGLGAVCSVVIVRLTTVRAHPRRQIEILLAELRGAGAAALTAALATAPGDDLSKTLHARLHRADDVARAIADWQARFPTADVIDCEATAFAARVLTARIDTDHACLEIAERLRDGDRELRHLIAAAVPDLSTVLDAGSWPATRQAAADRAAARLDTNLSSTPAEMAAAITDRAVIAHAQLRAVDLSHPLPDQSAAPEPAAGATAPAPAPNTSPDKPAAPPATPGWKPWERWETTSRMAIQVMVATALATVAGEAISADRWYWAVLTAFIVFVGTTTRGAILTRASYRILGTLAGIVIGFLLAILMNGNVPGLLVMCVAGVFCTIYFGPLQYALQSFFLTVVLTALYGLLGVLDRHILELRLAETAVGAVIGVLCAYFVFSTSSRSALTASANHYFDVLDDLLEQVRTALTSTGAAQPVIDQVRRLDAAGADASSLLAAMSMSLLPGRRGRIANLEHLMGAATRFADRLAKISVSATTRPVHQRAGGVAIAPRFDDAVDHVLHSAAAARAAICDGARDYVEPHDTTVLDLFADHPSDPGSPETGAVVMLSRLDWVLLRAAQVQRDS